MREERDAARAEVERLERVREEMHQNYEIGQRRLTAMERRASAAETEVRRLQCALGMGSPWPVYDVLVRLAAAADHLFSEHDCDVQGNEEIREARDAARRIAVALTGSGHRGDMCPKCSTPHEKGSP